MAIKLIQGFVRTQHALRRFDSEGQALAYTWFDMGKNEEAEIQSSSQE